MGRQKQGKTKAGRISFWLILLGGLLLGKSLGGLIVGWILGLGISKIVDIMSSGLDTTTHNKGDDERRRQEAELAAREAALRTREEEERLKREQERRLHEEQLRKKEEEERLTREKANTIPLTGNEAADSVITRGTEMLRTIRTENDLIPDGHLSDQMDSLATKCEQIFRTVSEAPEKAPQVRKFMNYYLPTTLKMLANYRTMQQRGVSAAELSNARETTARGMEMVLTACQKQIDNLHRENMLDISTDIDVLEQMLKADGYMDTGFTAPRTAAEAQMRATSVPVMNFSESSCEKQQDTTSQSYQNQ